MFDHSIFNGWRILAEGHEHFVLIIDGLFDLVTNRNNLAHDALEVLQNPQFLSVVVDFLDRSARTGKYGHVLTGLLQRLNRETSIHEENQYISRNEQLKKTIIDRRKFQISNIGPLQHLWLVAPLPGEEHFVGALYTLFAHLVDPNHPYAKYWKRPLTFSASGIDAIAVGDEREPFNHETLESIEYKYRFDPQMEFNHPFSITSLLVCWEMIRPTVGSTIQDSYQYEATVKTELKSNESHFGFILGDLRHRHGRSDIDHEIVVLDLEKLLELTFSVKWRAPANPKPPSGSGRKGKK